MELDRGRYDMVCEQLKHCLLPELDRDIGDEPLVKEDFGIFRYGLEMNLQLLFDVIAKKERILLEPFKEDNTFRIHFVLFLQQQSGYDEAPFQTDNESISKQIRFLTDKYYKKVASEPTIRNECLKYYKEKLTANKWKRNIGAVYGFLQMVKLHQRLIQTKFTSDDCLFMLSVGMHLVEYFEPVYKKFGIIIFNILLEYGNSSDLQKLNLYQVISKKLMQPLIQNMTDEEGTVLVLSCVYKCIESFEGWRDPSMWNEVDDVLEIIMDRIPIETDNRCTAILFMFVCSVTTLPMEKPRIFSSLTDIEHLDQVIATCVKPAGEKLEIFSQLRDIFSSHHNLLIGRWSKRLLRMFKDRDVIGKAEEIRFMLFIMHIVYICAFYGSPWFMGMKWQESLHELISNFMKLVAHNVYRDVFMDEIYAFLDTIKLHLETAERTVDAFQEADEEHVTNLIKSIHDLIPELKKFCISAKEADEKERQSRKSEFASDRPELPEDKWNLDSDD
ncbi:uncharacterized protein LOC129578662 [Sitodiplosis mosellana]|uniref:uncharacterized protein LOC129578662 n=1 Tax=Sitodiplosis mosellana TaxID=263140 RepID=UPI002445015B|nr:uncharacterized protein LOC129578662 [Sitodiplosis mosellana]